MFTAGFPKTKCQKLLAFCQGTFPFMIFVKPEKEEPKKSNTFFDRSSHRGLNFMM